MASKAVSRTKRPSKSAKSETSTRGSSSSQRGKTSAVRRPATKAAPARRPANKAPPARRTRPAAKSQATSAARPKARGNSATARDFSVDKVHQVALQATNLDDAVNFYRDILGLRFIARFDPPGYAFFDMGGGLRLVLSATASGATLYFRVVDIDGAVKALKRKGVSFLNQPSMIHRDEAGDFGKRGVEEWVAFFHDPSGNVLALAERR